ncbi:stage V sporulation protein AA [Radiobacillus deserti]|uniref:Stage V sporulation protein AA n=1 Tax=Radiobacillus deserti TaxID=2594883 RepID=A0A516KGL4_9BACI|nr:stage V sporulation protein AA [Radiobacillus deserti]QDP40519.1 stage V sporulation protein AA [Radiobacillus deserti]
MDIVYIRMKKKLEVTPNKQLQMKDIAFISASSNLKRRVENTFLDVTIHKQDPVKVLDGFSIIEKLNQRYPEQDLQLIGPSQTILYLKKRTKAPSIVLVSLIWLLLFVGSAMAIMNFHYDVSMQEVQQKLHFLLTGKEVHHPLWLQIPYSIGLGVGMILFFNHLFKKRFNEEPSPLEVEMFKYQQDLDQYVSHYENEINTKDATSRRR